MADAFRDIFSSLEAFGVDGEGHKVPYVPYSALQEQWTVERVRDVLQDTDVPPAEAGAIVRSFLRVFSTLVFINKSHKISLFLRHNVTDDQLPLTVYPPAWGDEATSRNHRFFGRFQSNQWRFCPMEFNYCQPYQRELDGRVILPITFLEKIGTWHRGDPVKVWKVWIDGRCSDRTNATRTARHAATRPITPPADGFHAVFKVFSADHDAIEEFNAESKAYRSLPNEKETPSRNYILDYYGSFVQSKRRTIVLEYADRGTLLQLFQNMEPPRSDAEFQMLWGRAFCLLLGLHIIHRMEEKQDSTLSGMHQDIQPCNILVFSGSGSSGNRFDLHFKIGDFGAAQIKRLRLKDGQLESKRHNNGKMNRMYLAPECSPMHVVQRHAPNQITATSDVWALGAVFSETLIWCFGGEPERERYRLNRTYEIQKFAKYFCDTGFDSCFHNGIQCLEAVHAAHKAVLRDAPGMDLPMRVSNTILETMLQRDQHHPAVGRLDSMEIFTKFTNIDEGTPRSSFAAHSPNPSIQLLDRMSEGELTEDYWLELPDTRESVNSIPDQGTHANMNDASKKPTRTNSVPTPYYQPGESSALGRGHREGRHQAKPTSSGSRDIPKNIHPSGDGLGVYSMPDKELWEPSRTNTASQSYPPPWPPSTSRQCARDGEDRDGNVSDECSRRDDLNRAGNSYSGGRGTHTGLVQVLREDDMEDLAAPQSPHSTLSYPMSWPTLHENDYWDGPGDSNPRDYHVRTEPHPGRGRDTHTSPDDEIQEPKMDPAPRLRSPTRAHSVSRRPHEGGYMTNLSYRDSRGTSRPGASQQGVGQRTRKRQEEEVQEEADTEDYNPPPRRVPRAPSMSQRPHEGGYMTNLSRRDPQDISWPAASQQRGSRRTRKRQDEEIQEEADTEEPTPPPRRAPRSSSVSRRPHEGGYTTNPSHRDSRDIYRPAESQRRGSRRSRRNQGEEAQEDADTEGPTSRPRRSTSTRTPSTSRYMPRGGDHQARSGTNITQGTLTLTLDVSESSGQESDVPVQAPRAPVSGKSKHGPRDGDSQQVSNGDSSKRDYRDSGYQHLSAAQPRRSTSRSPGRGLAIPDFYNILQDTGLFQKPKRNAALNRLYDALGKINSKGGRDQIFLIDDASSMAYHKSKVEQCARVLAYAAKVSDPDGMDVYFTSEMHNRKTYKRSSQVEAAIRKHDFRPYRTTNMAKCLGELLDGRRGRLRRLRRASIYVLTDAVWEDCDPGVDHCIVREARTLKEEGSLPSDLMIQFIRFGDQGDSQLAERLRYLDDDLVDRFDLGEFDIVDTRHCDGDVSEMLIGSISRVNDRRSS